MVMTVARKGGVVTPLADLYRHRRHTPGRLITPQPTARGARHPAKADRPRSLHTTLAHGTLHHTPGITKKTSQLRRGQDVVRAHGYLSVHVGKFTSLKYSYQL